MNELEKVFKFEGQEVRTIVKDEGIWFVAKDVCDILEIKNTSQAIESLDVDERSMYYIGRQGDAHIINESGLYALIFKSRKLEAKAFRKWVTSEVLPSIRQDGGYILTRDEDDDESIMAKALLIAQKTIDKKSKELEQAQAKIEELAPYELFAKRCMASNESILVRELSKIAKDEGIDIGEKKLYQKLREWGLILKCKTEPSQQAMNMKLFEVIQRPINTPYGEKLTRTTKVTPKGQIYIIEKLIKELEQ